MTDSDDESDAAPAWPPAAFARHLQEATQTTIDQQAELYRQFLGSGAGTDLGDVTQFGAMSTGVAAFKTRVQSGGRLSIPDAEREALGIEEGDLVQALVIPIETE